MKKVQTQHVPQDKSLHALKRMQQRGLNDEVLELTWDYGAIEHTEGALIVCLPRNNLSRIKKMSPHMQEKLRKTPYFVCKNGKILTAGWRCKRIKKKYRPWRSERNKRGGRT